MERAAKWWGRDARLEVRWFGKRVPLSKQERDPEKKAIEGRLVEVERRLTLIEAVVRRLKRK